MNNNATVSTGGIGVFGLLGVAFVVLKLTGFIDWSWWWVTAPFWGPVALVATIGLVIVSIAALTLVAVSVFGHTSTRFKKRRRGTRGKP